MGAGAADLFASQATVPAVRFSRLRIAIDARKIRDYGIGTYLRNLLRHLSRLDSTTEYVVLCGAADGGTMQELGQNFRAVTETAKPYSVAEQIRIPLDLRREKI